MTESGDHGGETSLETGAALLIYSPRPIFDNQVCKDFILISFFKGRLYLVAQWRYSISN